jgi:hypothetical protein
MLTACAVRITPFHGVSTDVRMTAPKAKEFKELKASTKCRPNTMSKRSQVVSFRAEEDLLRLIDQARANFEISRGALVRGITQAHFHARDDEPILAQLSDVRDALARQDGEIVKLQTNLARMLFAVLTVVGEMDPEDAKRIVRNKLLT